jgi:hypothetical protein
MPGSRLPPLRQTYTRSEVAVCLSSRRRARVPSHCHIVWLYAEGNSFLVHDWFRPRAPLFLIRKY